MNLEMPIGRQNLLAPSTVALKTDYTRKKILTILAPVL